MDVQKFKESVRRLIKKGKDSGILVEDIKKIFEEEVDMVETRKNLRKKTRKRICRPVLMISDSSCDDMSLDQLDSIADRSSLSSSLRLPTKA